jgi:F420-non-reducing hydrogenase iron-sulfur subunit
MTLEPKIIAFCCNWCSYAAADLAGTARMRYPEGVRIIRMMCSGMVHPELVVEALKMGADAVMVLGCRLGECHYLDGNHKALARADMIVELLDDLGYERERFSLHWLSSAEPDLFVAAVEETAERVRRISASEDRDDGES